MPEGRRPRGVTPRPRSGAAAESTSLRRRRNGREELPCVRGQGGGREEIPVSEVRGGDERSYPASEVRGGGREELPHTPTPEARPFLRNQHIVFRCGYIIYILPKSVPRFPLIPIVTSTWSGLSDNSHSNRCEVICILSVLICIFQEISGVKHLFMHLLAIFMSSLKKYLLSFSAHFKIRFFCY